MTKDKAKIRLEELGRALGRLKEILGVPEDHTGRVDAVIQRFEFTYELAWKTLKAMLEMFGHEAASPKQAFQKAYVMRWLDDEDLWTAMMQDRNMTSHTYKENVAMEIAARIPGYLPPMEALYLKLRTVLEEESR